jgi:hypothetical protein
MEASNEQVLLTTARSSFEAKVIVAVLASEGIKGFNSGGNLMDEFAVAQVLLNLQGVDVFVSADSRDAANQALEAAREVGKFIEGDSDD